MSWQIELGNGIYLRDIGWHLDATKPVDRSFASHAHFDHLGNHKTILCSPNTAKLAEARLGGDRNWSIHEFDTSFEIEPGTTASLYPAGHILGSSMIRLEREGVSLLYTGDFKLTRGQSAEPCATPQADILIMETTYGLPRYVFPPEREVVKDIVRFCQETIGNGETPVLFGYSLGKSQGILQALSDSDLQVMLHPKPLEMCETCEKIGIEFPHYEPFDLDKLSKHVVISPPLSNKSSWLEDIPRRKTAMISGWGIEPNAIYRFQCDKVFPLSDHADYLDLVEFVAKVNPKKVFTVHGYAEEFAATLREQGYDALALGKENQLNLGIEAKKAASHSVDSTLESIDGNTLPADAFYRFAETCQAILATDSENSKIELLSSYLGSISGEDTALAALFFTSRIFSDASTLSFNVDRSVVKQAALLVANASDADYKILYQNTGDSSEAIACLFRKLENKPNRSLKQIRALFDAMAQAPSPNFRISFLSEEFRKLTSLESKYLIRLIGGDLGIGLKEEWVEIAIAQCFNIDPESVRSANLRSGNISKVVKAISENRLDTIKLEPFRPLEFMRPIREASAANIIDRMGDKIWTEDKFDGVRVQIHKVGDRVELYNEDLNLITNQFPEIVEAAREIPQDFVSDGELVGWKNERPLPFSELQTRIGRKGEDLFLGEEIPVLLWLFDLLWFNGNETIDLSLERRRKYLDTFTINSTVRISPETTLVGPQAIEAEFNAALSRGNAGIITKNPRSHYQLGKRSEDWIMLTP